MTTWRFWTAGLAGAVLAAAGVAMAGLAGAATLTPPKPTPNPGLRYAGTFLGPVTERSGSGTLKTNLYVAVYLDGTMLVRSSAAPASKGAGAITVGAVNALGVFTAESLTYGVPVTGRLSLQGARLQVNYSYTLGTGAVNGTAVLARQR